MTDEKSLLESCRLQIEKLVGWDSSDQWTNQDFEELTDKIMEKTGVSLSVSTLKRIWGRVKYDSSPTAATLNALAQFLGHANWKAFRIEQQFSQTGSGNPEQRQAESSNDPGKDESEEAFLSNKTNSLNDSVVNGESINQQISIDETPVDAMNNKSDDGALSKTATADKEADDDAANLKRNTSRKNGRRRMLSTSLFGIGIIAAIYFMPGFKKESTAVSSHSKVFFKSEKLTDDLPNSVIFSYDLTNVPGDSFFLQQNWDPRRRERISPAEKKHSSIYYYPGNFTARLVVNNEIKAESRVYIQTKGWKGIIHREPLPVYLSEKEIHVDDGVGVASSTLSEKISSPVFNEVYTEFDNIREFDSLNLNNFVLQATLQNTSTVEQALCRKVSIWILGIGTAIAIPLSDKGCASLLNVMTGDTVFSGRDNDHSKLGVDFSQPHDLVCQVKDEVLSVLVDGKEVFSRRGQKVSARIIGLRLVFEGTGTIQGISIGEPGKSPIYDEQF